MKIKYLWVSMLLAGFVAANTVNADTCSDCLNGPHWWNCGGTVCPGAIRQQNYKKASQKHQLKKKINKPGSRDSVFFVVPFRVKNN